MALHNLVRYVSRRCAEKPRCNLYEMAAKYDSDEADVMAFLRCQRVPPRKMLRELCHELDIKQTDLDYYLKR